MGFDTVAEIMDDSITIEDSIEESEEESVEEWNVYSEMFEEFEDVTL